MVIDAPRERVYDFLCDLANRPAFFDHFVEEYRLQRIESIGVGAAARFRVRRPRTWMETVIESVDPPHRIDERGRAGRVGRVETATVWEVVEGTGTGTAEVRVTFWTGPTNPFDRVREALGSERRYRRGLQRALARLKVVIEGDGPVERVAVAGADRVPVVA
jgi:uncharacterized protein YndB with AHSA1/START domain